MITSAVFKYSDINLATFLGFSYQWMLPSYQYSTNTPYLPKYFLLFDAIKTISSKLFSFIQDTTTASKFTAPVNLMFLIITHLHSDSVLPLTMRYQWTEVPMYFIMFYLYTLLYIAKNYLSLLAIFTYFLDIYYNVYNVNTNFRRENIGRNWEKLIKS